MVSKIKSAVFIFAAVQFLMDAYILIYWRRYVLRNDWDKLYFRFPLLLSVLFLIASVYITDYYYSNPIRDSVHNYLYLAVTIWWVSKVPAFIGILAKDSILVAFRALLFTSRIFLHLFSSSKKLSKDGGGLHQLEGGNEQLDSGIESPIDRNPSPESRSSVSENRTDIMEQGNDLAESGIDHSDKGTKHPMDSANQSDNIDNQEELPKGHLVDNSLDVNTSKREFLLGTAWTVAALPYLINANAGLNTRTDLRVKKITIPILDLPVGMADTYIAQISDLHLGSYFDKNMMKKTINKIESLGVDMTVVTGDFVNYDQREYERFYDTMKAFKKLDNVYGCLGNHDHYVDPARVPELVDMIISSGIDLLTNENRIYEKGGGRINIAGIDNIGHGQRYGDFNKMMMENDGRYPTILMAHDPRNWDESIVGKRKIDLTLSGHTHGGQMVFEFGGARFSPVQFMYKQWMGMYSTGEQHIYVNTGLGTVGPPMRIGVPPEITLIKLVPAEKIT